MHSYICAYIYTIIHIYALIHAALTLAHPSCLQGLRTIGSLLLAPQAAAAPLPAAGNAEPGGAASFSAFLRAARDHLQEAGLGMFTTCWHLAAFFLTAIGLDL